MAVGNLGGLIVTLGLDSVQFFTGLTKSEQQAKKFADRLEKDVNKGLRLAKQGFTVMTGAAIAAGVALDQLVKHAGDFKDLEEKTGASAEALASFSTAAAITNTSAEDIGTAMNKLAKNLTGVDDDSKAAGAAIRALGLDIKAFKNLKPEERVDALAKAFGNFVDSPEKAAAAIALMGKAGANMLPLFKELEGGLGRQRILTQEQIEAADAYADRQKALAATISQYAQVIAIEALPALEAIIKVGKDVVQQLVGIDDKTDQLTRDHKLKEFGREVAEAAKVAALGLATLAESLLFVVTAGYAFSQSVAVMLADLDVLAKGGGAPSQKLFGAFGMSKEEAAKGEKDFQDSLAARNATLARANKAYDRLFNDSATPLTEALEKAFKRLDIGPAGTAQGVLWSDRAWSAAQDRLKNKPKLKFEGPQDKKGADEAERLAKARFDAELKQQERAIKLEQDLYQDRTQRLQGQYSAEQIGFREYYAERVRIADEANQKIADIQEKQIKLAEAFKDRPGQKEDDRLAAEQKYLDLLDKKADRERDAARARDDTLRDGEKALADYTDQVKELDAQILEMSGDLEAAAKIRFTAQNRSLRAALSFEGDTQGLANVDAREKQILAQERLTKAQFDYGLVVERLGIEQARIDLATQSGAQTTLDGINKKSEAAQRYAGVLRAQLEVERIAAQDLTGPARVKAELDIARLETEIEALQVSAHELENTFRTSFSQSLSTHLEAAINRTESLGKAFKGMVRDITDSVTRLATQNIGEAIFGKSGVLGNVPGVFADLFGGKGLGGGKGFDVFGAAGDTVPANVGAAGVGVADKLLSALGLGKAGKGGDVLSGLQDNAAASALSLASFETATAASAAGVTASFAALTAAATTASTALAAVSVAKAGGALVSSGGDILSSLQDGGGGGGFLSGLFDNISGFFAEGGAVAAAAPSAPAAVVGERGAEAFVDKSASREGVRLIGEKGPTLFRAPAAGIIVPHERVLAVASRLAAKTTTPKVVAYAKTLPKATHGDSVRDHPIVNNALSFARTDAKTYNRVGDSYSRSAFVHSDIYNKAGNSNVRNASVHNDVTYHANRYLDQSQRSVATRFGDVATTFGDRSQQYTQLGSSVSHNVVRYEGDVANISRQFLSRDIDVDKLAHMLKTFGGFFAEGGTVQAGKPIIVGERGPEIFQPFAAGNIVPNSELASRRSGRGVTIGSINITVPGNVSRSTANQIAVQTAAALRRATAKDA